MDEAEVLRNISTWNTSVYIDFCDYLFISNVRLNVEIAVYFPNMKILLHICCAPCALYPYYRLKEEGFDTTGYFYNPNIHPYLEYRKRLETVREFSVRVGCDVAYRDGYDLDHFLLRVAGKGPFRCEQCYRLRLEAAGAAAKEKGAAAFTTSLLYSKYQQHDLIMEIGKETASQHGVEFYYEDFRRGWREGIIESKAMGLYRQQYCGCIYSERDRYEKRKDSRQIVDIGRTSLQHSNTKP